MSTRDDRLAGLLHRVAEGDALALQELFLQERSQLQRLFLGLSRCTAMAEDLVQLTFLSLWRYRTNFRGEGSASAYLYRIAVNQWRRGSGREVRRRDAEIQAMRGREEAVDVPAVDLERDEDHRRVWAAIDGLPDDQREAFVLHRFQGLSAPQIAAATGAKVKTVESRLRLALVKLTRRLGAEEGER